MEHLIDTIVDKVLDRLLGADDTPEPKYEFRGPRQFRLKIGYCDVPIFIQKMKSDFGIFQTDPFPHIIIDEKTRGWHRIQIIRHEVNHAAAFIFTNDRSKLTEEEWVDFAASVQTTIMRDNPRFEDWLKTFIPEDQEDRDKRRHEAIG
jgi:hypothetical protein